MSTTVTVDSQHRLIIPQGVVRALGIRSGDVLLVLWKPDRVVMVPKPRNFTRRLAGLYAKPSLGAAACLEDEHDGW